MTSRSAHRRRGLADLEFEPGALVFAGLVAVLRDDRNMFGYCYTQLTDTFQEQNGLFDVDRNPKFELSRIRAVQPAPAAYEARTRD